MSAEHDELFQLMLGRTTTKAVERILAAGYQKSSVATEMESLADYFEEMASLSSYSQPSAVTETWLEAAKYARSRIAA